jgi:hypothetical protein
MSKTVTLGGVSGLHSSYPKCYPNVRCANAIRAAVWLSKKPTFHLPPCGTKTLISLSFLGSISVRVDSLVPHLERRVNKRARALTHSFVNNNRKWGHDGSIVVCCLAIRGAHASMLMVLFFGGKRGNDLESRRGALRNEPQSLVHPSSTKRHKKWDFDTALSNGKFYYVP